MMGEHGPMGSGFADEAEGVGTSVGDGPALGCWGGPAGAELTAEAAVVSTFGVLFLAWFAALVFFFALLDSEGDDTIIFISLSR